MGENLIRLRGNSSIDSSLQSIHTKKKVLALGSVHTSETLKVAWFPVQLKCDLLHSMTFAGKLHQSSVGVFFKDATTLVA